MLMVVEGGGSDSSEIEKCTQKAFDVNLSSSHMLCIFAHM